MNPERLMIVPCVITTRTPTGVDSYGANQYQELDTQSRCWYSNPQTSERNGQVFTELTLYFTPDVELDHVTTVQVEGVGMFEVDGIPLAHRSPRTGVLTHKTVKGRCAA